MENWQVNDKALCIYDYEREELPLCDYPKYMKEYTVDGIVSNLDGDLSLTFVEVSKHYKGKTFSGSTCFPAIHFVKRISDSELEHLVEENKQSITV